MASTSGSRPHGGVGRISSTATTLFSDNQYLIAEIRKVMITMKEVAVDLERDTESQMVKELEDGLLQLLVASEDCAKFSSALQSVGHVYQPGEELTDFKKLFDDEITKSKANSSSIPPNHPLLRQFREAIWNVHHAGQPMPGEEQEDLVMTSTQFNLLNIKCPLTGKPITELEEPVRSVDCKHIYEKNVIMQYIRSKNIQCPVAGCPRILQAARVACDPLLLVEIEEMRSSTKHSVRPDMVEDFTELDEEDSG
ncbi:E3 SUMO-protein ligase MMS21 [Camellia lanceoleosa]|uniref:E3 SUMO-protein ligase MMS21 n=1 Tax=Camellia lanceoleosa TaxID=1840588 RepID=A0ACC0H3P9_9ERIC|nr:E3 SUMO-protein ligase MMS21 [Camellia lanceoleosa]